MVSGTTLTWTGATLSGSSTLKLKVADNAGNDGPIASQAYVLDIAIPTASVTTANVGIGSNVTTSQSTETGIVYLVNSTATPVSYAQLESLLTAPAAATKAIVTTINTNTALGTTGLAAGTYKVYAVDAAGNISAASANTITLGTPPTTTVATATFSSDTGISSTDFITNTASQTISGTLSAVTVTGETVEVSLDNGATWVTATNTLGQTTWSLAGQTISGSNTLQARVISAGFGSTPYSHSYALDTTAPAAPSAPDMTAGTDTGTSSTDNNTGDNTPTYSGTSEANATVKLYDTDGTTLLGTATADGSGNWTLTSSALGEGSHTLTATTTDAAGNTSVASAGLSLSIDTTAPTTTITTIAISADTGSATADFITKTAAQDISGTLSANMVSGELVQVSLDNGSTWATATTSVGANTWSLGGQTLVSSNTIKVRVTDTAGNSGSTASQAYVFDNSAPTASVTTANVSITTNVTTSQSTESGFVYLVSTTASPADYAALEALVSGGTATRASATGAVAAALGTTGLAAGTYKVYAVDAAGNISAASTNTVTLVNNQLPLITSNGAGATASINLAENTTTVTTVNATDADVGQTPAFSLTGGADQARFNINTTTGALTFVSAPNFEAPTDSDTNNTYVVEVTASDGQGGTDVQTLTVNVTDLKASITSNGAGASSAISIAENTLGVTTVRASAGEPGSTLSYQLAGGSDASLFSIDAGSGALTFINAPDFEAPTDSGANNSYDVVVQVSDGLGGIDSQSLNITVTNANDAPTGAVTISGTPTQGQTLTAANNLVDADGPNPLTGISYQWFANGEAISGATTSTLSLDQTHSGKSISVTASYTDTLGKLESVSSGASAPVTNTNDAPIGGVTISGTPTQGQTLTADNNLADPDGLGVISYEWSAGGVVISGASGNTLVLGADQVGKAITVVARYTDGGGTAESISSSSTGVVVNTNDAPIGSVTISGTTTLGQTLTAANTLSDADGPTTLAISYQWQANGVNISGATSSALLLGLDQLDKTITVVASYTDAFGTAEHVNSASTAAVANLPNSAPTLALSGVLTDDRILENTSTSSHILVANIVITDDTQGNNTLSLTGADAASFEIVGAALYLKAGVVLDFETQTSYQVAVQVADASLGASTPMVANYTLNLINVNESTPITPQPDPTPVLPPVIEWPSLPDEDGDGTPEALEDYVKPLDVNGAVAGDGNGDGTADALQQSVASVPFLKTPTAISSPGDAPPVFVSLVADSRAGKPDTTDTNTAQLQNVVQRDAPANLPAEVQMPLGLISFDAVVGLSGISGLGVTETFSLYVDPTLGINGYWKLDANNTWVNLASAAYGGAIVSEGGRTRLDFQITDGGEFDADHTVNGTIVDPGAAGFVPLSLVGYAPESWLSLVGYVPDLPDGGFWF